MEEADILGLFSDYSHFEIMQLVYLAREAAAVDLGTYITALFAFLITAHFAGSRLSAFQLATVLFVYTLFMLFTLFALSIELSSVMNYVHLAGLSETTDLGVWNGLIVLMGVAWLLSIGFLIEVRGKKADDDEST